MAGENSLVIWGLSDGAPGHWSQSQGIADALAAEQAVKIERIDLGIRSSFWRRLGRVLLPWIRQPAWWLRRAYDLRLPEGQPDLIISSGGNTLLANALLGRQYHAPNVYSGTLKGHDPDQYRVVFTVVPLSVPGNCVLPLPPVPATISSVPMPSPGMPAAIAVLIGGDGAGYHYTEADWRQMADTLRVMTSSTGASLLLTTSRRTGVAAELLLQAELPADCLAEAVWWSQSPRPAVRDFLARSSLVVVTEDSLTMVAEAIYARRPVFVLSPQVAAANANDASALASYADHGLIRRVRLGEPGWDGVIPSATPVTIPDVPAMIRQALAPHLPSRSTA